MPDPLYLAIALVVSGIGFVMFMYGRRQHRPVQLGAGLLLLLVPYLIRDGLWLGAFAAMVCLLVWGGVKAGL